MNRTILSSILSLLLIVASCSKGQKITQVSADNSENKESMEKYDNQFAFDMLNQLAKVEEENLVFSPYSISVALAMTYAGARNQTASEMAKTMGFNLSQDDFHKEFSQVLEQISQTGKQNKQLQMANSLWAHEGFHFREEFFELIEEFYGSLLYKVDFMGDREAIRKEINTWVAERTNSIIKELIKPNVLVEDTRLVLVNAIYFLSEWMYAFDKNSTQEEAFYIQNGRNERVPFMKMTRSLKYYENDRMQVLEKPYEEGHFSMLILLPHKDVKFDEFVANTHPKDYKEAIEGLQTKEVELSLPLFKVRTQLDLEEKLAGMGMPLAFSNRADFTGISQKDDLKIDRVIHEAFIDVNEKGTEAAAATAVVIVRKTAVLDPEPKTVFNANRPFVFFIKDNATQTLLFAGRVDNPKKMAN